ncbi:Hypothetical predicted protein, partial [Marmota monax]
KCKLLGKVSLVQKVYEGLESSLKDAILEKESIEAETLETIYENLDRSISKLEDEILFLENKLKVEKAKHFQQGELMMGILKIIKSLEDESKSLKSQAKITLRIFKMNKEAVRVAIKESLNENSQLQEIIETKEDVIGHIKNLKTKQASLQAENTQFESENQNLQQKLKVMMELYQENYEKEVHVTEFAAQSAEKNLSDLREQNAHNRQKLTEMEFKFKLAEKDQSTLDVSNTASSREHSPNGPSPLGQPSSEVKDSLLEKKGPLRLSSLVPVGEGRGSRGLENSLDHPTSNERREANCDTLTDPQRAPSDTEPLAPPCEQAHRIMIPPPGQLYSDLQLPLQ